MFPASDAASIEARLLDKAIPEPNSGCWLWTASLTNKGYGEIMLKHSRKATLAHRVSYQLFKGPVSAKSKILHSCDMPCCVNPDHLHIGTQKENMREMVDRGRANRPRGEACRHKLSESDVLKIRADKRSSRKIAEEYGVTHTAILWAKRLRSWSHI